MTYPSPLPPPMAVEAQHLHLFMDRDPLSSLEELFSSDFQQQLLDHDRLLLNHTQQLTADLALQRRRFSRMFLESINEQVCKRLKAKEDEIETARKLNWALEERIRSLCIENQIWRELAQTNEATVNLLRANLEQVLAAQICGKEKDEERFVEDCNDAESCCCGENENNGGIEEISMPLRICRSCGGSEATVLLLPCRHLCLCAFCGPSLNFCPLCGFATSGSVNVNFS